MKSTHQRLQTQRPKDGKPFLTMAYWHDGLADWKGNFALVLGDPLNQGVYWIDYDIDDPKMWPYFENMQGFKFKSSRGYHILVLSNKPINHIEIAKGVDIRTNGIVIIPPSIHPDGTQYEWIE